MSDLSTTYMGIPLKSPIVVSACSISSMMDRVQMAERVGAGALVIRSLFEEQIIQESLKLDRDLSRGVDAFAESAASATRV